MFLPSTTLETFSLFNIYQMAFTWKKRLGELEEMSKSQKKNGNEKINQKEGIGYKGDFKSEPLISICWKFP